MLEPTTLPTARSVSPRHEAPMLTASSGALVPNATTVKPMTTGESPVRAARRAAPATALLINGRADVALAAGCAGVHLTSHGLPAAALRRRFGRALLIGCSTHRPEEVEAARQNGADYAIFGPVFATPSKAAFGPPPGLDGLARAVGHGLPVIAIGGIDPGRVPPISA